MRQHRMGHVKDGLHVHIENFVESGFIHFQHGTVFMRGTSVVNHDVGNTKGVDAMLHQGLYLRRIAHVASESTGLCA